jgi:hypothetical protein
MESDNVKIGSTLIGSRLTEIQKKPDEVNLIFENSKINKAYILSFKGLLFETSGSTLNRKVKNIQLNDTLGFRAFSQLQHLNRNPENYRQLFIQMEGSNDDNKMELIGALRNYKISSKRRSAISPGKSSK